MRKLYSLLFITAAFSSFSGRADVVVDDAATEYWRGLNGKYITITGSRPVSSGAYDMSSDIPVIGRSVVDNGNEDNNLRMLTGYTEPNRYWFVEYDETNNGVILKNAITDKYIGTMGVSPILLHDEKTSAGIVRMFVQVQGTESIATQYIITTTMVNSAVNPAYNAETSSYNNAGASTNNKVWLFCANTNSDIASFFAAPNNNSHWDVESFTADEALADYAESCLKGRFSAISDAVAAEYAKRLVADLSDDAETFAQKAAEIKTSVDALSSTYNFAPTATAGWVGKYIVISGTGDQAENNNTGRMMFDSDELTNLSVKRDIEGLNKYWIAEPDALYSGAYLKNAVTGRYIGTVGKLNNTVIPMQTEKSEQAGVVMMYLRNGVQFVTTTKIRDGETLVNNPNINHVEDLFFGFANFGTGANVDNQTKLWMFCTEGSKTDTDAHPVKNYGNGNSNGYWEVSVLTEAEVLKQLAIECIKKQHEWLTDEAEIDYWAGLVSSAAAALPEKTITEKYEYVRSETASKRYLASELDGKQLIIGSMDDVDGLSLRRISNIDGALSLPATAGRDASVWTATYNEEEDGVSLSNDNKYIARMPVSGNFSLTDNADEAGYYRLYKLDGQYALTCTKNTDGSAVSTIGRFGAGNSEGGYWMQGKSTGVITRWGSNPASSRWQFTELDDVVLTDAEVAPSVTLSVTDDNQYVLTIAHVDGLAKHHALLYEPSQLITISAVASESGADVRAAQADDVELSVAPGDIDVAGNGTLTYSIDHQFEAGTYAVNIPAGLFRVGENQKSKEVQSQFTVKDDGTLAIVEIESKSAPETVYDLSGRRLSAPVKGINIINGRKVLVK